MTISIATVLPIDVTALVAIQWSALAHNPLTKVLYPRGATAPLIAFSLAAYEKALTFPSARFIKATDDATGEVVGFAKWILYRQDEGEDLLGGMDMDPEEKRSSRRSSGWVKDKDLMPKIPPDCHGTLLEKWGRTMQKTRRRITGPRGHACITGAPCSLECYFSNLAENLWVLDILHVDPQYQRHGAGAALIDWGIRMADLEGIQCYVEASPAAQALCRSRDFRHVADMHIDLSKYREGFKTYRHIVMLRPAFGRSETPPSSPPLAPRSPPPLIPDLEICDPFSEDKPASPLDAEVQYTAEAKILRFHSTSSLRSADTREARNSGSTSTSHPHSQKSSIILVNTRSSSRKSSRHLDPASIDQPPPLPKKPLAV